MSKNTIWGESETQIAIRNLLMTLYELYGVSRVQMDCISVTLLHNCTIIKIKSTLKGASRHGRTRHP